MQGTSQAGNDFCAIVVKAGNVGLDTSSMPIPERKKKSLFKKFVAACGSNPKTMIVFSWLAIAYLMPVLFLPWLLIAYVLHSNGVPLAASIFLASIPAFIGLRIHMRWRN